MSKISAEEVSLKIKKLLDELAELQVHLVVLASFTKHDGSVAFGVEMNTSQKIATSLLKAGSLRIKDCTSLDERISST